MMNHPFLIDPEIKKIIRYEEIHKFVESSIIKSCDNINEKIKIGGSNFIKYILRLLGHP